MYRVPNVCQLLGCNERRRTPPEVHLRKPLMGMVASIHARGINAAE
jgi:hypothetical protein